MQNDTLDKTERFGKGMRKIEKGFVYLINDQVNNRFKIGAAKIVSRRLSQLKTGNASRLTIICRIPSKDMYADEKLLHDKYQHRLISGEWYLLTWDEVAEIRALAF
jgi:hypothetical protein